MPHTEITARHYATGQPLRLVCAEDRITVIEEAAVAPENLWLAPALVDLQVNGYGGVDFQQDGLTLDELLHATRQLRAAGCATWLLTLITDEWAKLTARLRHLRALRAQSAELQQAIAGWHIEGPFLSAEPGFHGAHPPAFMLDPTPAHVHELREITGADPLLLTLAPERKGAIEAIALAASFGMKISLGHTDASAVVLKEAVAAGATGFTHLANGCPRELDRHDNILWRVLELASRSSQREEAPFRDRRSEVRSQIKHQSFLASAGTEERRGLTVSLIPDGNHVSPAPFRLFHRLLDSAAIYYTTDAMAAAGAGPGRFRLGALEVEVGDDQIVRQPGKTNFAGSALRPIDGVFRAAEMLGCSWQETWRRASESPAKFMGLGEPADWCLVEFDKSNDCDALVSLTVLRGPAKA
ncbi:MAG: N-acetylglucosamine-6-phosphate deacetylase [Verrucomicrobia bacterium]|nr:N-acetylglucosamine-6-phosphate deacetylase [Verrucomicrobiota bacterium]